MTLYITERFKRAYKTLPEGLKAQVREALKRMGSDLRRPSLQAKKIKGTKDIWEARVSLDCRLTFNMIKDRVVLRNVGRHDETIKRP